MSDGIAPGSLSGSYRETPSQDGESATPPAAIVAFAIDARDIDARETAAGGPAPADEWSDSLKFVRDVAERVREAQNRANAAVSDAREAARRAIVAMWEAQERAIEAETRLAAASARAEEAEEQLRLLRSQGGGEKPVATGVDRWLNEAYLQLRLASEKRQDDTSG